MFDLFYLKLFSTNTKILSIKICLISLKLFSFLSKNFKFGMVKIYSINYCYIIIICIFLVIYQSNEVLFKVLDNLQIILLGWCFVSFGLVQFYRINQNWDDVKVFFDGNVYRETRCFVLKKTFWGKLQLKQVSQNVSDFLQVNSNWYNLKTCACHSFQQCLWFLRCL